MKRSSFSLQKKLVFPFEEKKIWGSVTHLFSNKYACVSMLQVERGSWCSIHYHNDRANQFAVVEGKIIVSLYGMNERPNLRNIDRIPLSKGEVYSVPSKVWHRFEVIEQGHLVEVYWPDRGGVCDFADIVRFCEGGRSGE